MKQRKRTTLERRFRTALRKGLEATDCPARSYDKILNTAMGRMSGSLRRPGDVFEHVDEMNYDGHRDSTAIGRSVDYAISGAALHVADPRRQEAVTKALEASISHLVSSAVLFEQHARELGMVRTEEMSTDRHHLRKCV